MPCHFVNWTDGRFDAYETGLRSEKRAHRAHIPYMRSSTQQTGQADNSLSVREDAELISDRFFKRTMIFEANTIGF
jgi:hypothetical protein